MRRSAESWQFILPVIATISIISILLACAQDLTGPATENRNSGAQPTDLALRGAGVPADAANPRAHGNCMQPLATLRQYRAEHVARWATELQ